jgi:hypothetical protein
MTGTTYLSTSVLLQLDWAQSVIDRHLGECVVCGTHEPCAERRSAEAIFARYGTLPKRTPGRTNAGVSRRAGFAWFEAGQVRMNSNS